MALDHMRFTQPQPQRQRKRWERCWGGLSCFHTQKAGGNRVAPASRITDANASQPNGHQAVGLYNQTTAIHPSLLAPPSSPASFLNSAIQSTAQSPNCFLSSSADSPRGPSSTMFATGPYAHETQLVSPPVFSTYTTEPSTAPFTPLTTPSSPDVPFARFLASTMDLKNRDKANYIAANDLQTTYSLYLGSPASLRSPVSINTSVDCISSSFPDCEVPPKWDPSVPQAIEHPRSESGRSYGLDAASASKLSRNSNFFCPATFAQFYLDQSSLSQSGGRLSVSKESDVYYTGGNGHQSRQYKANKQDVEEIEAYRASFGFSADEIVTTAKYVEISDVKDDSFTIAFTSNKSDAEETIVTLSADNRPKTLETRSNLHLCNDHEEHGSQRRLRDISTKGRQSDHILSEGEGVFSETGTSRMSRMYDLRLSSSDAEVDYRRGRSLRDGKGNFAD